MTDRPAARARAIALAALLAASAAVLTGCTLGVPAGSPATPPSPTATGTGIGLDAAARAALDTTPGRILSIEQEQGGTWEVLVADADGAETELHLHADGSPVSAPETKATDPDYRAENTRYLAADALRHERAADRIRAEQPGRIEELGLDDRRRAVVWEADVVDAGGVRHGIAVDAGTGALVDRSTDADDD